ncbi:MAG: glycosyltransferase family A protein [Phormidesmis sp.]
MIDTDTLTTNDRTRSTSVTVGIVAWNEEKNIKSTLESLLEQTLFADLAAKNEVCQIVCVCNGCVDNTAAVARAVLEMAAQHHPFCSAISYKIVELEQAGKLNALNHLFQTAAPSEAEFLIVMDADITIHSPSSLASLCAALQANSNAWFAIPRGIKRGQLDEQRNLQTNMSVQGSALHEVGTPENPNWVPGQMYCVRRSIAQAIYFPKELLVEDMFLSTLAHSHFFSKPLDPPDKATIVKVDSATYIFEPYLRLPDILANQKRQAMAHVLQELLINWIFSNLSESERGIAGLSSALKAKDAQEDRWLGQLLTAALREKKLFWQMLPNMYYTWPLRAVFEGAGRGGLALLPVALLRSGFHLLGLYMADSAFRDGQTYFWVDKSLAAHAASESAS